MHIHIPKELQDIPELEQDLALFFDLMIRKLHLNRHKGFVDDKSLEELVDRLDDEQQELRVTLDKGSQFDVALECVDVANQAFLLALYCLHQSKPGFKEEQNYANVRPEKT